MLLAPAFTNIKSAGDVTSAAYTIKGVLDTARTYAKANNTYTWVGFYEEERDRGYANKQQSQPHPWEADESLLLPSRPKMERRFTNEQHDPATAYHPDRIQSSRKVSEGRKNTSNRYWRSTRPDSERPTPIPDTLNLPGLTHLTLKGLSPFDHFNRIGIDSSDGSPSPIHGPKLYILQNYSIQSSRRSKYKQHLHYETPRGDRGETNTRHQR